MSDALLGIDKVAQSRSTDFYDSIYKMASTLEKLDELQKSKTKTGSSGRPAITKTIDTSSMIRPSGAVPSLRGGTLFSTPNSMVPDPLLAAAPPELQTQVVKPAVPATLGTDQLEVRKSLLPYVTTLDKKPEEIDQDVKILLTEPDLGKALRQVTFGSKKNESQVVLNKDLANALKVAGFDVQEGQVMSENDYKRMLQAARMQFSIGREKRITGNQEIDLGLKRQRFELGKAKEAKEKAQALIFKAINESFGGKKSGTTSSGMSFTVEKE
jgi:hypothetical protein